MTRASARDVATIRRYVRTCVSRHRADFGGTGQYRKETIQILTNDYELLLQKMVSFFERRALWCGARGTGEVVPARGRRSRRTNFAAADAQHS